MTIERQDIAAARGISGDIYTTADYVRRIVWATLGPLFRCSPRHLYGWRNFLLRLLGAKIGKRVCVYPSARIFAPWRLRIADDVTIAWEVRIYNLAEVSIGERCIVSQHAHLCAGNHDFRQAHLPFNNKPIVIESDCWICADAFVGSGVTVGRLAVVGARAVVTKNVPPRAVMAGNPAKQVGER